MTLQPEIPQPRKRRETKEEIKARWQEFKNHMIEKPPRDGALRRFRGARRLLAIRRRDGV